MLLSINSLFATLTCIPIFLIARRTFGERHRDMVGLRLGTESLCMVLVGSLDLGHDLHAVHPRLLFLLALELQDWPGLLRQGWALFGALYGVRRAGQSHDARVPSLLRLVDLAAAISARTAVARRRRALIRRVLVRVLRRGLCATTKSSGASCFSATISDCSSGWATGQCADGMLMAYLQPNLNQTGARKISAHGRTRVCGVLQAGGVRMDSRSIRDDLL